MRATERGIPFLNGYMIAILNEMVKINRPVLSKEIAKLIGLNSNYTADTLRKLAERNVISQNLSSKAHSSELVSLSNTVNLLLLIATVDNYGLVEHENITLNQIDKFITTWSNEQNKPVEPRGKPWQFLNDTVRRSVIGIGTDDFRVKHCKGVYSVRADLMQKYLVWKQISKLLLEDIGMLRIPMVNKPAKKQKDIYYVSLLKYHLLKEFCKNNHPIRLIDVYENLELNKIDGLHSDLSTGLISVAIHRLHSEGLLNKIREDSGKVRFYIKDKEKTAKINDLIESVGYFGLRSEENTAMRNLLVVFRIQNLATRTPEQQKKFNCTSGLLARNAKHHATPLYDTVKHPDLPGCVKLIPKPHVAHAMKVWGDITRLIYEIKQG